MPSNQWLTVRSAKSICAGVTRTRPPRSHGGHLAARPPGRRPAGPPRSGRRSRAGGPCGRPGYDAHGSDRTVRKRLLQTPPLTPTSYIVLGLLAAAGEESRPTTSSALMAISVDNFWSTPHAQVYREPERLAAAGLLAERREETGRRRRFYAITDAGRAALDAWRRRRPRETPELRDPGVLKLFFGADPAASPRHARCTRPGWPGTRRCARSSPTGCRPASAARSRWASRTSAR